MLLMDLGGWTVDLMRIDNAIPAEHGRFVLQQPGFGHKEMCIRDRLWARQTQVQRLSAAKQPAYELQVRGCGVQHHYRRSRHLPPRPVSYTHLDVYKRQGQGFESLYLHHLG